MGPRSFKLAVAVSCAAAIGIAAPAQAGGPVDSTVSIKLGNSGAKFKGEVDSTQASCVVGRKVTVWRVEPGPNQKLEKTFASESGKYSVEIPMQSGNKLYAKIKRFDPPPPADRICTGDRSENITA